MRVPPTPYSLMWLINRKSRLAGEILRLQKAEIERIRAAQLGINQLRAQLARAVENSDHVVQVSVAVGFRIAGLRSARSLPFFPYKLFLRKRFSIGFYVPE